MMKAAIVGIAGTTVSAEEALLLRALCPAGVILFGRNIVDPGQLRRLNAALRACLPSSAVLMVDMEGGRVARLRPPHWPTHPSAGAIGAVYAKAPAQGIRAAYLSGALVGLTSEAAGFDVVCAPVLDLRVPGASDVVGDRAFAGESGDVARLARAYAAGLLAAGVQPVGKHAPGHGRARTDSHHALPIVEANNLDEDLVPFAANSDLPWLMTAHILYPELDPVLPATLSPAIIEGRVRRGAGYSGVLVSDDLAMHALAGDPAVRANGCLAAGCDIALYCPGDMEGNRSVLAAVPRLTPAAIGRLEAGRSLANRRRLTLNAAACASERAALLA